MYGQWATDSENLAKKEPFEIPMQGLGVFSCRTSAWLGFNPLFRGFGGEEDIFTKNSAGTVEKLYVYPDLIGYTDLVDLMV